MVDSTSTKVWLFAGSEGGANRFADQLSLVSTAQVAGVDPGSYIANVLPRLDTWPHARLGELLPHLWAIGDESDEQAAQ